MRVLRFYHAGRDDTHRARDRALVQAGAEVTLVVPAVWPGAGSSATRALADEAFDVIALAVRRPGDVNRHRYTDPGAVGALVARLGPDVVDLHEEPFSAVTHQLLSRLPVEQRVVGYTAQNLDKRFPPPFSRWERTALARLDGLYPCSRQAASVVVGKGFRGPVRVLPLGVDAPPVPTAPGAGSALLLVGRMVTEKGVLDAVEVLATVRRTRPDATLTLVGEGPAVAAAHRLAALRGVGDALHIGPWTDAAGLAAAYAAADVLLAPSRTTAGWVEQYGRMVGEAHAAGLPVVGYASGALPEVVGAAGVLVAEGDTPALAGAVAALLDSAPRRAELRRRGLELAAGRTWASVAAGQLALYAEAIESGPRARRVRPQRAAARADHGPPAGGVGHRPFAAPLLRDPGGAAAGIARVAARLADLGTADVPERTSPLSVVFLDHSARLSGGEIALARLLAAAPAVRSRVILAEEGALQGRFASSDAAVEVLPLAAGARRVPRGGVVDATGLQALPATAVYVVRLARRLRVLRPDVVHVNSLKAAFYGAPAARLAGIPVVWHLRDRIAEDYLPAPVVALTRVLLRTLPDVVIANSRATALTAGVSARVIGDPYAATRTPAPEPDSGYVVGMIARIAPWKAQDVLLRAAARVDGVRVRIVGAPLFGEDDYLAELRRLVHDLDLTDRVHFAGFVDDIEEQLASVHVAVHASTTPEPFGQVVIEALAAGRAVVASDAGGPAEILTDGVDGLLVPPGDVASLAAALERLRDPQLRARLRDAGLIRARDFAPEVIAAEFVDVWQDAARLGRRRAARHRSRG